MSIAAALAILLALSLGGNAWLSHTWLATRDQLQTAQTEREYAQGVATTCGQATERLEKEAAKRKREAAAARQTAADRARDLQTSAQRELATPATVPGDDCRSATDRAHRWLQGRARP